MSLICFDTDTQHILFNNWISEVHEKAKKISRQQDPAYLVYADENEDYETYVYFVNKEVSTQEVHAEIPYEWAAKVIIDVKDCNLHLQSMPVHCNPTVDMSTMSLAELVDSDTLLENAHKFRQNDLYDYAIEDITIEKIIQNSSYYDAHSDTMCVRVRYLGLIACWKLKILTTTSNLCVCLSILR